MVWMIQLEASFLGVVDVMGSVTGGGKQASENK